MSLGWQVAVVSLWLVVLVLGFVVLGFLRRVLPVLERSQTMSADELIGGLSPGTHVGPFSATDERGRALSESVLEAGTSIVLFLELECEPCEILAAEMRAFPRWSEGITAYVVSGPGSEEREFVAGLGASVIVENDHSVSSAFRTSFFPVAYRIDPGRVVAKRVNPSSIADLEEIAMRTRREVRRQRRAILDDARS